MKVKALVSLIALAFAGVAQAAISTNTTTAEMAFVAFDTQNSTSYTLDTGVKLSDLSLGKVSYSFNVANDANWSTFLSDLAANGEGVADVSWFLAGVAGSNANYRVVTTVGAGATFSGIAGTNGNVKGSVTVLATAFGNNKATTGNSSVDAGSANSYTGGFNSLVGNATGPVLSSNLNNIGTTGVSLFGVKQTSATASGSAAYITGLTEVAGFDGTNVTIAASVPEPSSFALVLTALAGIGFVVRRRAT